MARSMARAVRGASWDGHRLPALAVHDEGPVSALQAELVDVGAEGLRDAQAVEGSEHRAWSWAVASPAATRQAPSALRSRPTARDS
jgi:hypothetical protein